MKKYSKIILGITAICGLTLALGVNTQAKTETQVLSKGSVIMVQEQEDGSMETKVEIYAEDIQYLKDEVDALFAQF